MSTLAESVLVSAHLAIIFLTLLSGVVFIKNYWLPDKDVEVSEHQQHRVQLCANLSLSDSVWSHNHQALMLALSKDCRHRQDRMPAYQKISKERRLKNLKIIAAIPADAQTGLAHLNNPVVGRINRSSHHLLRS